ncbi:hypothetical protein [Chryseobacterium glaciei]|nr:hypothetical protein [Chryseobacterium glaciei]
MKKLIILSSIFSSLFAYSQMAHLVIFNNSTKYVYHGQIAAGDFTGSNCALTVKNFDPSVVKANLGEELRYEDFKGQMNSSIYPVNMWEINDGVVPPYTVYPWDPILSYDMPNITKWAFTEFDLIDPNTGNTAYTGQLQSPAYPCASYPNHITTIGLPTNVYMEWIYMTDPIPGNTNTINAVIINDL